MTWDLETAKKYLGIEDSTQDAQIQAAMDTTLTAIETMLQRKLMYGATQETIYDHLRERIYLRRFPLGTVLKIDDADPPEDLLIDPREGWIAHNTFIHALNPIVVDYEGGYQSLPLDLERAMWEAFQYLWSRTDGASGAPVEEGTEAVPGGSTGDISRITVQDFGSITFGSGGALTGPGGELAARQVLDWGWLHPWSATLQMYRSEFGVGLGVV